MRLPAAKTTPILTPCIREVLLQFSGSIRKVPFDLRQRSKIILLAADGLSNKDISQQVNLHRNNVSIWRKRYLDNQDFLHKVSILTSGVFTHSTMLIRIFSCLFPINPHGSCHF